jgi:hypothetical protein
VPVGRDPRRESVKIGTTGFSFHTLKTATIAMINRMYFIGITGSVMSTGRSGTIAFALATTGKTHKPFILHIGINRYKVIVMIPIATTRKIDASAARVTDWMIWLNGTVGRNDVIRAILANRTTVPA